MHQNNRQNFLFSNLMKNEAESQAVFAVSYMRNVRGRAMLLDSTVILFCVTKIIAKPSLSHHICREPVASPSQTFANTL